MGKITKGRLICFEGLDGAGKTTIAKSTTKNLISRGIEAQLVKRKDPNCPSEDMTKHMLLLKELIWEYRDLPLQKLGDYHALYNMASWFSAIDSCKIKPLLNSGITVVVDNWYYKFLARFIRKNTISAEHLKQCFSHLTIPDLIIYLDVNPEVAAERKNNFNKGETGFFDDFGEPSRDNFIIYQKLVKNNLNELAQQNDWFTISVDSKTPEQVAIFILERIEQLYYISSPILI